MRGEHTRAALCAKAIKQELKKAFPSIKFSVKSENFAGGDSVDISYIDGVAYEKVYVICSKYQYGHFDGMIDYYEISNHREDIPQAKYVSVRREFSDEVRHKFMLALSEKYGLPPLDDLGKSFMFMDRWCNYAQLIYQEYNNKDVEA